ncbi:hypothetical protein HOY80DRAFT_257334 [Tuber brumale]|nr:hypothetical protein HOY80DRAFT_257334 [Tuber brumale]
MSRRSARLATASSTERPERLLADCMASESAEAADNSLDLAVLRPGNPHEHPGLNRIIPSSTWTAFLTTLSKIVKDNCNVYPYVVHFPTIGNKKRLIRLLQSGPKCLKTNGTTSGQSAHQQPSEALKKQIMAVNGAVGVESASNPSSSKGTVYVFANQLAKSAAAYPGVVNFPDGPSRQINLHYYVVYYKAGKITIYDPEWIPGPTKVYELPRATLFKRWIEALRFRRRRVEEVWIGGGDSHEYPSAEKACRAWLQENFDKMSGPVAEPHQRKEWVKLQV